MDRISDEELQTMMEFYEDVDVDFGDKNYNFAELLKIAEGDSCDTTTKSTSRSGNRNNVPFEVVCEDDVDAGEVYDYSANYDEHDNEFYHQLSTDISADVFEVTGGFLLNESLENRYKELNVKHVRSKPKSAKSSSEKASIAKIADSKILNKAELRKEMAGDVVSPEEKVTFKKNKKHNALVNALVSKTETNNHLQAEDEIPQTPEMDPVKKERIWKWVMEHQSSGEEYHTASASSSSNYLSASASASASDSDTTKKYRATSQRSKIKSSAPTSISSKTPTATSSDEVVGFKCLTISTSKPPTSKTTLKKSSTMAKKQIYIPGTYDKKFHINSNQDFPALRCK